MNLEIQKLSNDDLTEKLNFAVREERKVTLQVLKLLREVERRELFARLGYSSLFTYCVEHLKYSESAAQRRIVAMRAIQLLPELEVKIESGKLSLSVLALAESTLQQNAKRENRKVDPEERRLALIEVEGLSRRKAEAKLVEKFDLTPIKIESVERALKDGGVRMVLELTAEEMQDIEELRRLSSRPQTAKEMLMTLVRTEVSKKKRRLGEAPLLRKPTSAGGSETRKVYVTAIPTALKRDAWMRAGGQCEYHAATGERCISKQGIEFDHIVPRTQGGNDRSENLRLVCRAHHRLVTTEMFGISKMQQFRATLRGSVPLEIR